MCGIVGVVGPDAESLADAVDAEAVRMQCRGPDAGGVFRDRGVVLAHRRLAILDLTPRSNQPFSTPDNEFVLTFNGEIYNFRDLDRHAESDTIALLGDPPAALDPARLRGMFAYGLWSRKEHCLVLVRDRFGMKPLYYGLSDQTLIFGSTASCVARLLGHVAVSVPAVASFLRLGSVQGPETIYRQVHELEPGCVLRWQDGTHSTERYWQWEEAERQQEVGLEETLRQSVTAHCVSDVPVAVFLSGGLDSAIIGALAHEADRDVTALTLGFAGMEIDETESAVATARAIGLKHEVIETNDPLSQIDDYLAATDQPSIDGLNTYLIAAAAASRGFRVALSGVGADELFAGYSTFRRVPALAAMNSICPPTVGSWLLGHTGGNRAKSIELVQCGSDFGRLHEELRSLFTMAEVGRLVGMQWHGSHQRNDNESSANTITRLEFQGYLRNTLLRDSDVFSMAHSLELRMPFVDHLVVSSALGLNSKTKLVRKKRLVADMLRQPRLRQLARMRKRGFSLPYDQWLRGPLQSRVDELAQGPLSMLCDTLAVASYLHRWRDSQEYEMKIWALVVLDAWLRRFTLNNVA